MSTTSERFAQTFQCLTEELQDLRAQQDEAMRQATYIGMSSGDAKLFDERRHRIYEIYETLLVLNGSAAQS